MTSPIIVLDSTLDSITLAWRNNPNFPTSEIEFRVNKEDPVRKVAINGHIMKKKGLNKGDTLEVRLLPSSKFHTFFHPGETSGFAPPKVTLELGDDVKSGSALIELPPGMDVYQVEYCPLDAGAEESAWIFISDNLKSPAVRKKNMLAGDMQYSFRFRGKPEGGSWTNWSAATPPLSFPPPQARNALLARAVSPVLIDSLGAKVDAVAKLSGCVIALYFSASWCPPCRATTPKLLQFSQLMKQQGKRFQVVFVSLDHDSKSFQEYFFKHMQGWLAIPFEEQETRERLQDEHKITGVPSLKILSHKTGKVVEAEALKYPMDVNTFHSWEARM